MSSARVPPRGGRSVLVGSTGFVGSNLLRSHPFDLAVHSTDIERAFGQDVDLVVYAGVPAAMFLANSDPEADLAIMARARANLRRMEPREVVLISTIAVYADSRGKDERDAPSHEGLSAYGRNRLQLEEWVREDFPMSLIVRLPALFGPGIRKNFIFDLIHLTPMLLASERYEALAASSDLVRRAYEPENNGFWRLRRAADTEELRAWFSAQPFNALSFTDSRSKFQMLDLTRLWSLIDVARFSGLRLLNVATPPLEAAEIYRFVRGGEWQNHLSAPPFDYDMRSIYGPCEAGENGYFCDAEAELRALKAFVDAETRALARTR